MNRCFRTLGPFVLAGVMTLIPGFAHSQTATKAAPQTQTASKAAPQTKAEYKPSMIEEAGAYSKAHRVISIYVSKGTENEANLTGQQVGEKLAGLFQQREINPPRTKIFVNQSTGKYTAVGYFVWDILYGPYGLKESVTMWPIIAGEYDAAMAAFPPSGVTPNVKR